METIITNTTEAVCNEWTTMSEQVAEELRERLAEDTPSDNIRVGVVLGTITLHMRAEDDPHFYSGHVEWLKEQGYEFDCAGVSRTTGGTTLFFDNADFQTDLIAAKSAEEGN